MNWYQSIDEIAKNIAQAVANNPESESEIQDKISGFPRNVQQYLWSRINYYIKVFLEQGGGTVEVFI